MGWRRRVTGIASKAEIKAEVRPLEEGKKVYRLLGRFFLRLFLGLAVISLAAYAGDWVVYRVRGSPRSTVAVSRYMSIPLKGNKEEFDYLGTVRMPCAVSLFPHGGWDPCWHLRRSPNEWENF